MPVIEKTKYHNAPFLHKGGHLQTLLPGIFRKVEGIAYTRERITLEDGDFLDLDWLKGDNDRLVVLTHGLEGNSTRQYVMGMAKIFHENNWDVLAWHCRSCSGEMNKAFKLYHHGDTADISAVIEHARTTKGYKKIALVGFSMGANISLKYLGVKGNNVPSEIQACVVFSGPCALEEASNCLDSSSNWVYKRRFLKALSQKLKEKDAQYPGILDINRLKDIKQWRDFDEWFSAPICGYKDADEFYAQSSSKNFVAGIRVPSLLINSWNDPILTPACMPFEEAKASAYFHFELTQIGGHCGFAQAGDAFAWSERRALEFCLMSNE